MLRPPSNSDIANHWCARKTRAIEGSGGALLQGDLYRPPVRRRRTWPAWVAVMLVVALASSATTFLVLGALGRLAGSGPGVAGLDHLLDVLRLVEREYVDKVDEGRLMEGATRGMVDSLDDPYSGYMDAAAYHEIMLRTSGSYSGVGMAIEDQEDGFAVVISTFEGGPAAKAGILPGDRIIKVGDKTVVGVSTNEVAGLIQGPSGSAVTIVVARGEGDRATHTFTVTRSMIDIPSVKHRMLGGGIGYLQLTQFVGHTARDTGEALTALRGQGMRALVLDLRNNPGGLVDQCVEVARMFIPSGPIVHVVDRSGKRTTISSRSGRAAGCPLVVLVNGNSASASEILAGAIQDSGLGKLVGVSSFGKAAVTNLIPLEGGAGLNLMAARYLTPLGRTIDKVGLTPDVVVPDAAAGEDGAATGEGAAAPDPQLEKALEILRAALGES